MMGARGTFWVPSTIFLHHLVESHRRRGRFSEADAEKVEILARMRDTVALADKLGARILPGDDYGFAFLEHRPGVYGRELTVWVRDYGMAAEDVLRWATVNGAALQGLDGSLGIVEPGALADLIVLRENPLDDISIFENPADHLAAVMVNGQFHKRELASLG